MCLDVDILSFSRYIIMSAQASRTNAANAIKLTPRERRILQLLLDADRDDNEESVNEDALEGLPRKTNSRSLEKQQVQTGTMVYLCPVKECQQSFSRPDNLSRHLKNTTFDDAHRHIVLIMEERYCQICRRLLRRQCDFWRHMRSKHPKVDWGSWAMKKAPEYILGPGNVEIMSSSNQSKSSNNCTCKQSLSS